MSQYAKDTEVSVERTQAEIKLLIKKYGAKASMIGENQDYAVVMFEMFDRQVRFTMPLPTKRDKGVRFTETGKARSDAALDAALDRATRSRWRALLLAIKAKLEMVASHIASFEAAFLADIVLPNKQTVGEWAAPQIQAAYDTGNMPPLLPAPQVEVNG